MDVNCAAIPETLLEAELFGFERGAFTDARQAKPGLFQSANGGTIFLDEVGLLPISLQSKLLKVIEERSVRRLGSTRNEPLDVADHRGDQRGSPPRRPGRPVPRRSLPPAGRGHAQPAAAARARPGRAPARRRFPRPHLRGLRPARPARSPRTRRPRCWLTRGRATCASSPTCWSARRCSRTGRGSPRRIWGWSRRRAPRPRASRPAPRASPPARTRRPRASAACCWKCCARPAGTSRAPRGDWGSRATRCATAWSGWD